MSKSQPTYSKEFKQEAVRLFKISGKSKTQIAKDLGISDSAKSLMAQRIW
jgi:transposase-like protein